MHAAQGLRLRGGSYHAFFGGEEFDRLSPSRRVRVMQDSDLTLCNSSLICTYLDEASPDRPLLLAGPADRARAGWTNMPTRGWGEAMNSDLEREMDYLARASADGFPVRRHQPC